MLKMVLKTQLNGSELFDAIRAAAIAKHRNSKTIKRLLKKGETKIITRVELKTTGALRVSELTAIVDILEAD